MAHGASGGGHTVRTEPGRQRVRVTRGGVVLAETSRPRLLHETGLPVRHYLPPEDVATELLRPTATTTHCPFKGDAHYWAVADGTGTDIAWTYRDPLPEVAGIRDHLCFYPGRDGVEVEITEA